MANCEEIEKIPKDEKGEEVSISELLSKNNRLETFEVLVGPRVHECIIEHPLSGEEERGSTYKGLDDSSSSVLTQLVDIDYVYSGSAHRMEQGS